MKQYKIYENEATKKIEAVKIGWSWPGFFFGLIWALVKKLWAVAIGLLVLQIINLLLSAMLEAGDNDVLIIISSIFFLLTSIVIPIIIGVQGNSWREKKLISRGFVYKDVINAGTPEGALSFYMMKNK
ncbi:DUF2628 domain-containing protein [Neisseria animalis]|uniref:DUF2628 domain-containing protein n=1 Tax=Neisseria animalis TaxID=492 RepID=A0A5P3MTU7_NEIAN|nr:DUF2628 domain-containing protein [Neisseria animalis]QEY25047.1 DUF2628 domain-containing protein [Neisseria animalis]ROW31940.1 DUF2628 domain-containing protein [Neisseria animalis]